MKTEARLVAETMVNRIFVNSHTGNVHKITGILDEPFHRCSGPKLVIDETDCKKSRAAGHALMWIGAYSFQKAIDDGYIQVM